MKKFIKILLLFSSFLNFCLFSSQIDEIKKKIKTYSFFINGLTVKKLKSRISTFAPNESDILSDILDKIQPDQNAVIYIDQIIAYIDSHEQEIIEIATFIENNATKVEEVEGSVFSLLGTILEIIWNFFHPTSFSWSLVLAIFLGLCVLGLGFLISFLI